MCVCGFEYEHTVTSLRAQLNTKWRRCPVYSPFLLKMHISILIECFLHDYAHRYGYWSHDIGGHLILPSPELCTVYSIFIFYIQYENILYLYSILNMKIYYCFYDFFVSDDNFFFFFLFRFRHTLGAVWHL